MGRENNWAFPGRAGENDDAVWEGITIREYFAAMAMHGMLASGKKLTLNEFSLAQQAIRFADALIEELE